MDKKLRLSITYVVLLSLLVGCAILFSKPADKSRERKTFTTDNSNQNINAYKSEIDINNFVEKEAINVFNNEADLNLNANLVENKNGQVSINLAYKLNGKLVTKNIDTSSISEIRNIFKFRKKYGSGYKLSNMLLNRENDKLYFCVEGKRGEKYTQTTIYAYSLESSKIEKIFSDLGVFSDFSVSSDGKYNAFSYLGCPQNITRNEKTIVVIIRSSDNKLVLNSSEDILEKQDDKSKDLYVYSYDFIKWKANSICELSQRIKAKDGSQEVTEQTMYYNVVSNKLSDQI
ncbi:MAG TPA: hypothetical protein VIK72_11535 [Clostridiaceae bacterium]